MGLFGGDDNDQTATPPAAGGDAGMQQPTGGDAGAGQPSGDWTPPATDGGVGAGGDATPPAGDGGASTPPAAGDQGGAATPPGDDGGAAMPPAGGDGGSEPAQPWTPPTEGGDQAGASSDGGVVGDQGANGQAQ